MKSEEQKKPEKEKIKEENSHDIKKAEIKEESNRLADISKGGEELKRLKLNNKCVFIIQ